MHAIKGRCGLALAAVLGFAVSAGRAEMIAPDSIPHPPSAVGSTNGTFVYSSNSVTTQYRALGLNFSSGAAITYLHGMSVWAPTEMLAQPASGVVGGPPPHYPSARISYYGMWSGVNFVRPGSLIPAIATSLSVEIMGRQDIGIWVTYAHSNHPVAVPAFIKVTHEPNGGTLYTFPVGPGITSFSIFAPLPVDPPMAGNPAWGVAGLSYTLDTAPEPSSLVLVGLGLLGLAGHFGWRRSRGKIG